MTDDRRRVVAPLLIILAIGALALGTTAYLSLPKLAPCFLVEWGYRPTGDQVFYSGWKVDDRLEDMTVVYEKRSPLWPGPPTLEVLSYSDGEIALIHTPLREEFLYRVRLEDSPTYAKPEWLPSEK